VVGGDRNLDTRRNHAACGGRRKIDHLMLAGPAGIGTENGDGILFRHIIEHPVSIGRMNQRIPKIEGVGDLHGGEQIISLLGMDMHRNLSSQKRQQRLWDGQNADGGLRLGRTVDNFPGGQPLTLVDDGDLTPLKIDVRPAGLRHDEQDRDTFILSVLSSLDKQIPASHNPEQTRKEIEARRKKLLSKKDRYQDLYANALISLDELKDKLAVIAGELKEADSDLEDLTHSVMTIPNAEAITHRYTEEITRFLDLETITNPDMRRIIDHITVDKYGNIQVFLKKFEEFK